MTENFNETWMKYAFSLAQMAEERGEVPVGAVIVRDNKIVGEGFNCPVSSNDPSSHAEIVALRHAAAKQGNYRLSGTTLYVTIEPCTMCVGAIIHARVDKVVFGAREPRAGALVSNLGLHEQAFYNHRLEVEEGALASECSTLITEFFRKKRAR